MNFPGDPIIFKIIRIFNALKISIIAEKEIETSDFDWIGRSSVNFPYDCLFLYLKLFASVNYPFYRNNVTSINDIA